MALSFAVLGIKVSKDRQKKMTGISHRLEGCTGQKVAAKRPTLFLFLKPVDWQYQRYDQRLPEL